MSFWIGGSSSATPPGSGPRTCGIGCNININHEGGGLIVRKVIAGGPAAFCCELVCSSSPSLPPICIPYAAFSHTLNLFRPSLAFFLCRCRLWGQAVGDILLGVSALHETPDEVVRRLVGPEGVPITVTLRMRRTLQGEPQWREHTITLLRQPTIPFPERLSETNVWLCIDIARVEGGLLQVRRLQTGGAAQLSGKLKVGDVILQINGNDRSSLHGDRAEREVYMVRSVVLMGEFHMCHTAYRNQISHAIVQPAPRE
eukprot:830166-Rhodomonas_salina.1